MLGSEILLSRKSCACPCGGGFTLVPCGISPVVALPVSCPTGMHNYTVRVPRYVQIGFPLETQKIQLYNPADDTTLVEEYVPFVHPEAQWRVKGGFLWVVLDCWMEVDCAGVMGIYRDDAWQCMAASNRGLGVRLAATWPCANYVPINCGSYGLLPGWVHSMIFGMSVESASLNWPADCQVDSWFRPHSYSETEPRLLEDPCDGYMVNNIDYPAYLTWDWKPAHGSLLSICHRPPNPNECITGTVTVCSAEGPDPELSTIATHPTHGTIAPYDPVRIVHRGCTVDAGIGRPGLVWLNSVELVGGRQLDCPP